MKKFSRYYYLAPLLFLPLLFKGEEKKVSVREPRKDIRREVASTTPSTPSSPAAPRREEPRQIQRAIPWEGPRPRDPSRSPFLGRVPSSLQSDLEFDKNIKIPGGHLLTNVGAIERHQYHPSMGTIVSQNGNFTYFKTHEPEKFAPVAQDRQTRALYPLSSVLHIAEATPDIRTKVLNLGMKEYYYNQKFQLLSVQTSEGNLLKVYSDLSKRGYQVQLEMLKPGPEAH